jgi:C-terminal processing protease CtpA/Prc
MENKMKRFNLALLNLRILLVFVALIVGATQCSAQGVSGYEKDRGQMILAQVKRDIQNNYYDPGYHGIDVDAVFKAAESKIKNAQSTGQILGIIAAAVFELNDSHTFFLPPDRKASTDYGIEMQMIGDFAYVTKVKDKSDAAAKGIKVGDTVYLVDGYQLARQNLWKIVYLYYALRPQPGMRLTVASPGSEPREVDIIAKTTDRRDLDLTNFEDFSSLIRQSENSEAERKQGNRTKELGDTIIWKMPEFNLSADEVDSVMSRVAHHKSLILDLRGNPGGYESTLLRVIANLFDHDVKVGEIQRRKESKPLLAKTRGSSAFSGELVVLVDGSSASSAEILARTVQLEKRGKVIGDRTSGAVMRARPFSHSVGVTSIALYGINVTDADLKMIDGKSLEGVGVIPDEVKLPTGADLASKKDPILSYAAGLVGVSLDPEKAGALFPELKKP